MPVRPSQLDAPKPRCRRPVVPPAVRRCGCLLGLVLAAAASVPARAQTRVFAPPSLNHLDTPRPEVEWDRGAPRGLEGIPSDETVYPPRRSLGQRISAMLEGRTQIEGGYSFAYDRLDGARATQHVLPDLLVRYGLMERLELRVGWPGLVWTRYDGPLADQSRDETLGPTVGFMVDLWPPRGWLPQTAVLASVPITLQGNPFTMESLQPLSQVLYCWDLSDRVTLGGTTGAALFRVEGDNFVQLQQTASLDWTLTDRIAPFVEWEMLVDYGSADDGAQHLLGGGLSFLLTERLQLTWRAGVGVNDRAPDFVTGLYFAYRL
jgi:hypothetical protein